MNIIILANSDLASNYALNLLLPKLSKHKIKLYLSLGVGKEPKGNIEKPKALKDLKFFEQSLFNKFLFPLLDKTPNSESSFKTFKQLEVYLQQPIVKLHKINDETIIGDFKSFNIDLIISIRFGLILYDQVIATSKFGVINLHSGLLPDYQGVMATFYAMLHAEKEVGTSLHFISDSKIDSGDIIAQTRLLIQSEKSYLWHVIKLYEQGYKLIVNAVHELNTKGIIESTSQKGKARYFSFPNKEAISQFHKKGYTLFEPTEILDIAKRYM